VISTKLRELAQQQKTGDREWMLLHDLAQMIDRLFYGAVLDGYAMRCFRNELADAFDDDITIRIWPEPILIKYAMNNHKYFMDHYDWGDSAVLAKYGEAEDYADC
jgi:hypothetical protein